MKPPYYFTTDDRTKKKYIVWTCEDVEKEKPPTKIRAFKYTNETAHDVYKDVCRYMVEHMSKTGGCELIKAWIEAHA